jgi:hypothetical protein
MQEGEKSTGNRMFWIVVISYGRNVADGATSRFPPMSLSHQEAGYQH